MGAESYPYVCANCIVGYAATIANLYACSIPAKK